VTDRVLKKVNNRKRLFNIARGVKGKDAHDRGASMKFGGSHGRSAAKNSSQRGKSGEATPAYHKVLTKDKGVKGNETRIY